MTRSPRSLLADPLRWVSLQERLFPGARVVRDETTAAVAAALAGLADDCRLIQPEREVNANLWFLDWDCRHWVFVPEVDVDVCWPPSTRMVMDE
ncbi:MAG: hypothetical protein ACYDH6_23455 [Acidimicrobiales bacterium]